MSPALKKVLMGLVVVGSAAVGRVAPANTLSWNFSTPTGDVGSSTHTYGDTTNTATITAHGYKTTGGVSGAVLGNTWGGSGSTFSTGTVTAIDLYGKVTSGDPTETGLGLVGLSTDHEIQNKSFVQLDLNYLEMNHFTNLTLTISSIQSGEGFYIWSGNTLGLPGTLIAKGTNPPGGPVQTISQSNFLSDRYLSISATSSSSGSDVLLMNGLSAQPSGGPTPTPTPASVLGGVVLIGGLAVSRFRNAWRKRTNNRPVSSIDCRQPAIQ